MKLKTPIIKEGKEYGNLAISLSVSELIQEGVPTTLAMRAVPYADDLASLPDDAMPFVIGISMQDAAGTALISDIKIAIEKFFRVKGL
jgi:hypothetical protein